MKNNTNKFIEEIKVKCANCMKETYVPTTHGTMAAIKKWVNEHKTRIGRTYCSIDFASIDFSQAFSDAIKYWEERNKDTERLDFLDKMNKGLNEHYGTEYGWELILNHNVTRLFSGNIDRIDLNDAKAHGAKSCRTVIDKAIAKLTTSQEEG